MQFLCVLSHPPMGTGLAMLFKLGLDAGHVPCTLTFTVGPYYLSYIYIYIVVCTCQSQSPNLPLPQRPGNPQFVLYICTSISVL